ncbi:hypothetical protein HNY73_020972 [Argiope bruennichi]|uniref:Uncharacterized protein n=1 Tax=Argiope bruennichi TaxID=94029 RepID=A0A8T0ECF5_ARGBR|nr:hypothetical protein HNY73_020972 [Argiope bruennichi]
MSFSAYSIGKRREWRACRSEPTLLGQKERAAGMSICAYSIGTTERVAGMLVGAYSVGTHGESGGNVCLRLLCWNNVICGFVLSDCPSDFEFSDSDSDDSDIRPSKRQRRILSDSEADSDEEWNDIDIVPSLEDYSRNSRVPNFECDPPSIVDVIDSFF